MMTTVPVQHDDDRYRRIRLLLQATVRQRGKRGSREDDGGADRDDGEAAADDEDEDERRVERDNEEESEWSI